MNHVAKSVLSIFFGLASLFSKVGVHCVGILTGYRHLGCTLREGTDWKKAILSYLIIVHSL